MWTTRLGSRGLGQTQRELARHMGWVPGVVHTMPAAGAGEIGSGQHLYKRRKPPGPLSPPHRGAQAWHVFRGHDCTNPSTLPHCKRRTFFGDGNIAEWDASSCDDSEDDRREGETIKWRRRSPSVQATFLEAR
jgi:hypothetical protein